MPRSEFLIISDAASGHPGELGRGSLELFFERLGSSHPRYLRPNGFESSGTAIPEGRRARRRSSSALPSDCHRPRAIAGEGAQAFAPAISLPATSTLRSSNSRWGIARKFSHSSPRKPTTLFFGHLTPGGRAWADHPFAVPLGGNGTDIFGTGPDSQAPFHPVIRRSPNPIPVF